MKDAKFEVEIQLQHDDSRDTKVLDKILVFQCDSESSGSDSNRLKIKDCEKIKKKSQKIPRGRKLTMQDDDYFYDHSKRNLGDNSSMKVLSSKCIGLPRDTIIEEDDDRYGLDFLEEYRTQAKTNGEGVTAFTSEGEYVFSPVSKHTLKKKFSVKKVVRRQSFSSQQSIKKRKFTINDENPNELR